MTSGLASKRQFFRFFAVSVVGTILDYVSAVILASFLGVAFIVASTLGFGLGTVVNYCGHTIFSYEHTDKSSISFLGYVRYLLAVLVSLLVRLMVVAVLGYVTAWPFWLILLGAIGASFVTSYVVSTLWVFKKPD